LAIPAMLFKAQFFMILFTVLIFLPILLKLSFHAYGGV